MEDKNVLFGRTPKENKTVNVQRTETILKKQRIMISNKGRIGNKDKYHSLANNEFVVQYEKKSNPHSNEVSHHFEIRNKEYIESQDEEQWVLE